MDTDSSRMSQRPQRAAAGGVDYLERSSSHSSEESTGAESSGSEESVLNNTVVADPTLNSTVDADPLLNAAAEADLSVSLESLSVATPPGSGLPSPPSAALSSTPVMANVRANQLVAELEAIIFQLDELLEDVAEGRDMSRAELALTFAELKDLRVMMVKASQELLLASTRRDYEDRVNQNGTHV